MTQPPAPVRLCLASHLFFPDYGGAQLRFKRYLPGLRERGIDTEVLAGVSTYASGAEPTEKERGEEWYRLPPGAWLPVESMDGTSVYRVRLPDESGRHRDNVFDQALQRFCQRPETRPHVVQLLSKLTSESLGPLRRLRASGILLVYAVTIAPVQQLSAPSLAKAIKHWRRRRVLRKLYNRLDCLVANSSPLRDMIRGMGVRTPIEVIPNGVDLKRFYPDPDGEGRRALRRDLGFGQGDTVICASGALIPRKGTDLLIQAWSKVVDRYPGTRLLLIGPDDHSTDPKIVRFRQRLGELVETSGHKESVRLVGLVDKVEDYLRAADICALPSEREGLPNSVIEAMACGLPVVMTPFIGLSDDLGQAGVHYLLAKRDAGDLADKLATLVAAPALRAELGGRGHRWVEQTMDLERSIDRYADLYRNLAAGPRRGNRFFRFIAADSHRRAGNKRGRVAQ